MKYQTLPTIEDVFCMIDANNAYSIWARLHDRDDVRVLAANSIRLQDGQMQVNAGEYVYDCTYLPSRVQYLNDEWIRPKFIYIRHQCDDCSYPMSMCCGGWGESVDDESYESHLEDLDEHLEAVAEALYQLPPVVIVVEVED